MAARLALGLQFVCCIVLFAAQNGNAQRAFGRGLFDRSGVIDLVTAMRLAETF